MPRLYSNEYVGDFSNMFSKWKIVVLILTFKGMYMTVEQMFYGGLIVGYTR
jgi:hypothetical protein